MDTNNGTGTSRGDRRAPILEATDLTKEFDAVPRFESHDEPVQAIARRSAGARLYGRYDVAGQTVRMEDL